MFEAERLADVSGSSEILPRHLRVARVVCMSVLTINDEMRH